MRFKKQKTSAKNEQGVLRGMQLIRISASSRRVKAVLTFTLVSLVFMAVLSLYGRAEAPTASANTVETVAGLPSSGDAEIDRIIYEAGADNGVDPRLLYYVIQQESNFKTSARSGKNAQGLMQIIPATAERFDVENPYDPEQNIQGGARYLRWLLKEFNGDVKLALAGYNAGENAVKRCGNQVPDYKETQDYVDKIVGAYGKTYHPILDPKQAALKFGLIAPVTR